MESTTTAEALSTFVFNTHIKRAITLANTAEVRDVLNSLLLPVIEPPTIEIECEKCGKAITKEEMKKLRKWHYSNINSDECEHCIELRVAEKILRKQLDYVADELYQRDATLILLGRIRDAMCRMYGGFLNTSWKYLDDIYEIERKRKKKVFNPRKHKISPKHIEMKVEFIKAGRALRLYKERIKNTKK